jgi:glycosyltransferase involved in cell wall biosynthesis
MRRLAVYTAVYPSAKPYLRACLESVLRQTDRDFDLWISLDALDEEDVTKAAGREVQANWLRAPKASTPAMVRQHAFQRLTGEYDGIILVDSDDVMEPSRVEAARAALAEADVVGCGLRFIDAAGTDARATFGPGPGCDLPVLLPRYNVFGLSNTAFRGSVLAQCLPIPEQCETPDWLLATRAYLAGARLSFDTTPRMLYRQHAATSARVLQPFTPAEVLSATEKVLAYYEYVFRTTSAVQPERLECWREARRRATEFACCMRASDAVLARYTARLNAIEPAFVWWWQVAHPELEYIWKN